MSTPAPVHHRPRRRRSRRGEGEQLRDEIVSAAARLLSETGDEQAVSIRAIADAVGVTPPSIYLHFRDKSELMFAVCEDRFRELDRTTEAAAAKATGPLDEIVRRSEAYIRFGLDHPEHYRILFMEHCQPFTFSAEQMARAAAFNHMVEAVQRAVEAGAIAAGDPMLITISLWSAAHGITSLMITKPEFPWPPLKKVVAQVLRMCTVGVTGSA